MRSFSPDVGRQSSTDPLVGKRRRHSGAGLRSALTAAVIAFAALGFASWASANGVVPGRAFRFDTDVFSFANETVYIYPNGYAEKRQLAPNEKAPAFILHCFDMCRSTEQFRNFARFDPSLPAPDDATLARLVKRVTRHAVWRDPAPADERVVIPGYANLHDLSKAHPLIVQKGIGAGWTAYARIGNWRMFPYPLNGPRQQRHTRERVDRALARNDLFIGYLTTYPSLSVNHAIVIYAKRPSSAGETDGRVHYLAYDPNHPDGPRDMVYDTRRCEFSYQKDWDFVGGKVTMLQVFSYIGQ